MCTVWRFRHLSTLMSLLLMPKLAAGFSIFPDMYKFPLRRKIHLVQRGMSRSATEISDETARIIQPNIQLPLQSEQDQLPDDDLQEYISSCGVLRKFLTSIQDQMGDTGKLPPIHIDDTNVLFYDALLLINLTMSISLWVVHRLQLNFLLDAFSEGCLLCLLWICAGLYSGAFLYSAVNGHYSPGDERGGSKAAALLSLIAFLNTISLRLLVALIMAIAGHRTVGSTSSELLIPYEAGFGVVLMTAWRTIYATYMSRL